MAAVLVALQRSPPTNLGWGQCRRITKTNNDKHHAKGPDLGWKDAHSCTYAFNYVTADLVSKSYRSPRTYDFAMLLSRACNLSTYDAP